MTTPVFICGAECGLAATGAGINTIKHWAVANSPAGISVVTTPIRSGSNGVRAFRFSASAGTSPYLQHQLFSPINPTMVSRMYVYFTTLPTSITRIWSAPGTSGAGMSVMFTPSDNSLRASGAFTSELGPSGKVITTGVWYRLDMKSTRDTTWSMDLSVDGVAQTQYSFTGMTADSMGSFIIGNQDAGGGDFYIDDVIVSGTSADFPIGAGGSIGLYPNGDNSAKHVYNAANDFGKGSGGATNLALPSSSETTAWQSLQKPLSATVQTNFVSARNNATAESLRFNIDDIPSDADIINGYMYIATTHSATTTGNNFNLVLFSSGDAGTFAINGDYSETAIAIANRVSTLDPHDDPLTQARVNALTVGFIPNAASNDCYLDGFCLEVDYVKIVPLTATLTPVNLTLTPQALATSVGNVTASISPVVLTLMPQALAKSVGNVSRSLTPVNLTLTPQALTRSTADTTTRSLTPVNLTLTPQALAKTVGGTAAASITPVNLTLTPVALAKSVGGVTASITPVNFTLFPMGLIKSVGGTATVSISPATFTLTPIVITGFVTAPGVGNILPALFTISPTALVASVGPVSTPISPVIFTLTVQPLTYSIGSVSITLTSVILTLTPIALNTLSLLGGRPKVWTGTAWVEKPVKVWTGTVWIEKPMKVWTGSEWELV